MEAPCWADAARRNSNACRISSLVVLDGCTDCCATKKLTAVGLVPDIHIIATELGIEKKGMGDVRYDEIEKVVREVMDTGVSP